MEELRVLLSETPIHDLVRAEVAQQEVLSLEHNQTVGDALKVSRRSHLRQRRVTAVDHVRRNEGFEIPNKHIVNISAQFSVPSP
jgi:hypothetical protein